MISLSLSVESKEKELPKPDLPEEEFPEPELEEEKVKGEDGGGGGGGACCFLSCSGGFMLGWSLAFSVEEKSLWFPFLKLRLKLVLLIVLTLIFWRKINR